MALRFRKSIKIFPGVKVNLNKKSVGLSVGGKRAGITFNSKTGVTGRISAPGTGLSYRTKIGKKNTPKRYYKGTASQQSVLRDIRNLEQLLEEQYRVNSIDVSRETIYPCPVSPETKKEKPPPDPHRLEDAFSITIAALFSVLFMSILFYFFSCVFYDWPIFRYGIYGFWILYVIGAIVDIFRSPSIAEENRKYNRELDARISQAQTTGTPLAPNQREDISPTPTNTPIASISSTDPNSDIELILAGWVCDVSGKFHPPGTVWMGPHSTVYHHLDTCGGKIISSHRDMIRSMPESDAVKRGFRRCVRCNWNDE